MSPEELTVYIEMLDSYKSEDFICEYIKNSLKIEYDSIEEIINSCNEDVMDKNEMLATLKTLKRICEDIRTHVTTNDVKGKKGLLKEVANLSNDVREIIFKIKPAEEKEVEHPATSSHKFDTKTVLEKAVETMKSGNVMEFMTKTYNEYIVGNSDILEVVELSTCSQRDLSSSGLDPHVDGPPSWGKSSSVKGALHLQPNERVHETTVSGKALYFMEGGLREGDIIFSDDTEMSPELKGTYKRLHTNFQEETVHTVTERIDGQFTSTPYDIPARIILILTSVDIDDDDQILSRQLFAHVTADEDQAKKIWKLKVDQKQQGKLKLPESFNVQVCREINQFIYSHLFYPTDADHILDYVSYDDYKNIRNQDKFLDLVGAYCILNYMNREVIEKTVNGNNVEILKIKITKEDVKNARRTFIFRAEAQIRNVSDEDTKYTKYIAEKKGERVSREELSKHFKVSIEAIRKRMHGKDGHGGLLAREPALRCDDPNVLEIDGIEDKHGNKIVTKKESQRKYFYWMDIEKYDVLASYDSIIQFDEDGYERAKNQSVQQSQAVQPA